MADITINIKTGSDDSEPKVTITTDNTTTADPKTGVPKVETPKPGTTEETISDKGSPKGDDAKQIPALSSDRDMTEEEHAKMASEK